MVKKEIMEQIPEDLKADLKKAPSVEVILGHTFRVWHDGKSAKDYWVSTFFQLHPCSYLHFI